MTNLNRRTLLTSAAGLAGIGLLSACVSNSPGTGGEKGESAPTPCSRSEPPPFLTPRFFSL